MAGNDVFLWPVPSDVAAYDVRLRDPTTSGAPAGAITVTAAQSLADVINAANVGVVISATSAQTLANVINAANVAVTISATSAQTLADITNSANVDVVISATAAQTLADVINAANVAVTISATAGQTLGDIINAASAAVVISATASQTLADVVNAASVAVTISATAAQQLDDIINAATVEVIFTGGISITAAQTLADVINAANVQVVPSTDSSKPSLIDPYPGDEFWSQQWEKQRASVEKIMRDALQPHLERAPSAIRSEALSDIEIVSNGAGQADVSATVRRLIELGAINKNEETEVAFLIADLLT